MTGVGRGKWIRNARKVAVEDVPGIDVRRLKGRHESGFVEWLRFVRRHGEVVLDVHLQADDEKIVLHYAGLLGAELQQYLFYQQVVCPFGGHRLYLFCPSCERRVLVVYLTGMCAACRKCHELTYQSQRERGADRELRYAQNTRARLGGSRSMAEPFPSKPTRMRHRTYWSLWQNDERVRREYLERALRDTARRVAR